MKLHEMCSRLCEGESTYPSSCSNFELRRTSTDDFYKFGSAAAEILQGNCKVEEMLKTVETKTLQ